MFLLTIVGLAAGYLFPISNSSSLRLATVILFSYATLVMSMGTSFKHFISVLKQPQLPLWILFLTHFITPLIAWTVGYVMYSNEPLIRLGYLIATSVPIGVSSIVWTALNKGYVAVSLVAVTLDATIVPIILPAYFNLIIGTSIHINYWQMSMQLMFMVTIPSIIGMILNDHLNSRILTFYEGVGGVTSKLVVLAVIYINSAVVVSGITWSLAVLKISMVTMFMVIIGFMVGYCGSYALKDHSRQMFLTMMYNVGLRNNSVGLVLALSYFPPSAAIPITMYILFQQPMAAAIPIIFKNKVTA